MRNRMLSAPSVGRILAVGGSISFLNVISTAPNESTTTNKDVDEHGIDDDLHESCRQPQCQSSSPRRDAIENGSLFQRIQNHSRSWASQSTFAPQITLMESAAPQPSTGHSTKTTTVAPTLKIKTYDYVVIGCGNAGRAALQTLRDECPAANIALVDPMQSPKVSKKVEYYANRAVGLDPRERVVTLDDSGESVSIRYKHAVLMATGARGAPPPHYLMEDKAMDRIYELRPTVRSEPDQRPVMSPSRIQQKVLRAAAAGGKVCVLGSGWEAIDLVVAAAAKAPSRAAPALIFGNSGPLGHVLPSYLSAAVSKRLKSKKIDVQDRTLIRYISHDDQETKPCLQIYVAKSFDFLDTNRTAANLVVVAPEVSGARGSAVLPTGNIPSYLETTRGQRAWYETWSKLTMPAVNTPSTVVCYKEDGRIAVNPEMSACAGVYAAGSAAKYANGLTGHADVAGVGIEDGVASGRVAATNMSGLFHSGSLLGFGGQVPHAVTKDPIPVWRSDLRAYAAKDPKTSLPDVGITALCVGNCDSERFYTQGVWWTNQSAHKRMFDRLTEGSLTKRQKRRKLKESLKPVYGLGFVYYMDRSGKIQGIMSWGVPFTTRGDELNDELVQQMKTILTSNGEASRNSEIDHMRMTNFLSDESRRMVETAFSGFIGDADGQAHQLDGEIENFPRPYHRFTEVRPPNVRTLGLLKRKGGQGHGVLGEDLFARYEEAIEDAPPPRQYTAGNVGYNAAENADAMYEWSLYLQKEQQWDENESRARPAKEDPLWVRKGDEARNIASRENIAAGYMAAIWTPRPVR